jgi:hypothetical protein
MKLSEFLAIGAVSMASSAWAGGEVPEGWMVVADSSTQLTHTAGENGWSCWFRTGQAERFQPMVPSQWIGGGTEDQYIIWASAPTMGCASGVTVCHVLSRYTPATGQTSNGMHGNAAACCTPGDEESPMLRWTAPTPMRVRVEWFGQYAVTGGGNQPVTLLVNGTPAFVANETDFGTGGATLAFERATLSSLGVLHERCTPFEFKLRVLTPDCNGNLVPDAVEIADGTSADIDGDGVPDSCPCAADVVLNGGVDGEDLAAVLASWGISGGPYPRADIDGDGVVDGTDLLIVLERWGPCP